MSVNGEQTRSTDVVKKTLNPYWNADFDLQVNENSVLTIQVFDQKKWKKSRDQGFMGVVNLPLGEYLNRDGFICS
jgi:E3 ubiquitin-protein ligase NEDD4